MSKNTPAVQPTGAWAAVQEATDSEARYKAALWATTPVDVPTFDKPVPPMMFDFTWAEDDSDMVQGILASIAAADDITEATQIRELRKPSELVDKAIRVLGVTARKSSLEDGDWGAYLVCTVSVEGGDPETIHVGSPQVVVVLWRLWCEAQLPANGVFVALGTKRSGRNQALGFQVETAL